MIQLTPKQKDFLGNSVNGTWSINTETGLVDVQGDVMVPNYYIKGVRLPVAFGEVTGDFDCAWNNLNTLKGCPYWVGRYFRCNRNYIKTLKYAPKYIGRNAYVWFNPIESINWLPEHIGGELHIDLGDSESRFHNKMFSGMNAIFYSGIKIHNPDEYYYPFRDAYYESKLIEVL